MRKKNETRIQAHETYTKQHLTHTYTQQISLSPIHPYAQQVLLYIVTYTSPPSTTYAHATLYYPQIYTHVFTHTL